MEQFSNFSQSTLSASLDATATSVAVADASHFPAVGNFRVWVDDEIMACSGRTGNVLTVARGQEGTTAVSHSNGAAIAHGMTAASLIAAVTDRLPTASEVVRGQSTIAAASGAWQDVRDDSTLAYCELSLPAGRYLLLAGADAVLQATASGGVSVSLAGRIADTLGTVYGPTPNLALSTTPGLLFLGHVSWSALATLSASRTLRMQAARFDQLGGVTWQNSFFLAPSLDSIRLGD